MLHEAIFLWDTDTFVFVFAHARIDCLDAVLLRCAGTRIRDYTKSLSIPSSDLVAEDVVSGPIEQR